MSEGEHLSIRPYARLLTMLGEQLIKNERIALIELIKNAYDADADWVKISFLGFDENFNQDESSKIIIEDSGTGMDYKVIVNHFLNPATPEKKRKKNSNKSKTPKGRIIQGEKGIGRFAILKLGRKVEIITKTKNESREIFIEYDFIKYDDEFLSEHGKEKDLFIDDIRVLVQQRESESFLKKKINLGTREIEKSKHGTIIKISNLKGSWSKQKIKLVYNDLARLQSIFPFKNKSKDFEVFIYKDQQHLNFQNQYLEKLDILLKDRSVLQIEDGVFDASRMEFRYKLNGKAQLISIFDPEVTGLKVFKDKFEVGGEILKNRQVECGSFKFGFYIFDFSKQAPARFLLDREDKGLIKENRIYLYRDDIRVYPYGEPDDDWLKIDAYRGTISAGDFLSNDQVVGFVKITHVDNPNLKDKTNREGLIEEGNATDDFISIIQTFLSYIRKKEYKKYRIDLINKNDQDIFRSEIILAEIENIKPLLKGNSKAIEALEKIETDYITERKYLIRRAETTEELAGVGLSVETASHDIMAIMLKVLSNIDSLIKDFISEDVIDKELLLSELQSIRGGMSFIESQLKDIQLLFKSSKQRRKNIRVRDIVDKVIKIYNRYLNKENIQCKIVEDSSPLVAKTTDAVLLQLFLNLFDNSLYWLQQISLKTKKIEIHLEGNEGRLIFSDNGPGIPKSDVPYIFEPFYSGKGEEGRGLGLYIARQLLERNEYTIELAELKSDKVLSGANFLINFISEKD
ncbi:sensor histidine kinase [Leptospira weilii]|uniref:sensor histidine kinase n=1 Tax=Leptospira weilii TaxID=28184 RepID=UPI0002BE9E10|nr:ATP-binding protein [Leptospira weilii]EMN46827.1 GHKL domain protein [Leptospira weilii str. LNT 1234]MCL8268410.1 ATP-binding protein [Leptospira weilii]QDK22192.1 ATP-binding protein [Leptospira weilii]QDK26137.1 ATP-binding protein [Leptospira weilii]